jgi:hypothetical protein
VSLEETLAALFDAKVAPILAELQHVNAELAALRRALPPQLVSLKEAARLMGNISLKTASRRVHSGEWPSRKDGRKVLVDVSALRPMTNEEVAQTARKLRAIPGGGSNHGQE